MAITASQFREILANLELELNRDLSELWVHANRMDLSSTEFRRLIIDAYPDVVVPYHATAADVATEQYDSAPTTVPGFVAEPADPLPVDQARGSAESALNAGRGDEALPLLQLAGAQSMMTGARATTIENANREPGARWFRLASPSACGFCKMLATRGAKYWSEESGSFEPHPRCHCLAAVARAGQKIVHPPYMEEWREEYRAARRAGHRSAAAIANAMDTAPERQNRANRANMAQRARDAARAAESQPGTDGPKGPIDPPSGAVAGGSFEDDRARYRATPPGDRELDPRFAQPLGEVVDAAIRGDQSAVMQLARDLSGTVIGVSKTTGERSTFMVDFNMASATDGKARLSGTIYRNTVEAGMISRYFHRDGDGRLMVTNGIMALDDEHQDRGFASAFAPLLENYYRRSGVDRIEVFASMENGGYTWATQDFRWDPSKIDKSIENVVQRLNTVHASAKSKPQRDALSAMIARLVDENGNVRAFNTLPKPLEIASMATRDAPGLGKTVMVGSKWYGRKKFEGGGTRAD